MSKGEYKEVPTNEKKENDKTILDDVIPPYGYGVRHVQTLLIFVCLSVGYIARGHLSVSIVAMTSLPDSIVNIPFDNVTKENLGAVIKEANKTLDDFGLQNVTLLNNASNIDANKSLGVFQTYVWPKSTQEMILSSFFLGYSVMQFPMGLVAQRWGGKIPFQIGLFVNGVVTIITPWMALWGGWKAVCACRIAQGLSQAGFFPSIQTLLAKWVPVSERGTLASYVYAGSNVGTVVAFQVGGVLAESFGGWPSVFWASGGMCLLAFILITIFGAATPSEHKTISVAEKNFITNSSNTTDVVEKPKVPWKAIMTSKYVWACHATHVGSAVSFFFMFTQVPSYIHSILDVDVKSSGLLSSLPYIAACITSVLYGVVTDFCLNRKLISLKNSRRLFNSIAQIGVATCLISVSFTKNVTLAVVLLVLATGLQPGIHVGWMLNHIDLTPNFSGTLIAIGSTLMNIFVLMTPVFVSFIITDMTNQMQWRIMFIIVGSFAFVANAVYVAFMTTDVQPWNDKDYLEKKPKKK